MKTKVKLETEKEVTISDLTNSNHVGFISENGEKHYVIKAGDYHYSISTSFDNADYPNRYCYAGGKNTIEALEHVQNCHQGGQIKELYVFTTRKELYQWLAE